jgi:hypothetical protein
MQRLLDPPPGRLASGRMPGQLGGAYHLAKRHHLGQRVRNALSSVLRALDTAGPAAMNAAHRSAICAAAAGTFSVNSHSSVVAGLSGPHERKAT